MGLNLHQDLKGTIKSFTSSNSYFGLYKNGNSTF